ncbi:MAG: hypothetical protein HOY71_51480 [Nonomuraea sp.]|nr:hypothetical protein [Nonomuraea sp.]
MDGARPRPVDAVAVLVAVGVTVAACYQGPVLVVLLAAAVPVLWMRRAPLTVAWISAGTSVALPLLAPDAMTPGNAVLIWPPTCAFAVYAALAFAAPRHRGAVQWLPVIVLVLAVLPLAGRLPALAAESTLLRTEAVIAVSALSGGYAAVKARLRRELSERAERVERERLAGEMHDVVTHRVGRIVLAAGDLALTSEDERTRAVAAELRESGREALDELRHMLALLRRGTGEGFDLGLPLPDLRPLIDAAAARGVPVALTVEGTPSPVAGEVGRAAYQVVAEALAEARAADVPEVRVHHLPGEVRITVRGTPCDLPALRERVTLVGGRLETAKTEDGTYQLEAILPL